MVATIRTTALCALFNSNTRSPQHAVDVCFKRGHYVKFRPSVRPGSFRINRRAPRLACRAGEPSAREAKDPEDEAQAKQEDTNVTIKDAVAPDDAYSRLPGWVKGDPLIEGTDIRAIDVGSALGALAILLYIFRNSFS